MLAIAGAAFVMVSLGLVPSRAQIAGWLGTAVSERFPCEGHGCGCASAGECWSACCCHTVEQRLAWALANGVRPPADRTFLPEQWTRAARLAAPGEPRACCAGANENLGARTAEATGPGPRGLVSAVLTPLACKGGSASVPTGLPPVPFPEPLSTFILAPAFGDPPRSDDRRWRSLALDPVVPPPRA